MSIKTFRKHRNHPVSTKKRRRVCYKDSLVYDLMELFRQTVTDRFVLRLLNYGTLAPKDFTHEEETGCRLTEKAFPVWCAAYEDYMGKPVLKDYDGNTPREMIRKEVRKFACNIFAEEE